MNNADQTYIGLVEAFPGSVELCIKLRGDKGALVGNVGHHGRVNHHLVQKNIFAALWTTSYCTA